MWLMATHSLPACCHLREAVTLVRRWSLSYPHLHLAEEAKGLLQVQ